MTRAAPAGFAAGPEDFPALTEIANEPSYRWGTLRLPYQSLEQTRRWFVGLGANETILVAELDGQVVGNGGLHRQAGRRQHAAVVGMGVRDAFQRRGIGTAMLAALVDTADNWLDLRRLELTVYATTLWRSPFTDASASSARACCAPTPSAAGVTPTRC